MWQIIIVVLLVGAAVFFAVQRLVRTLKGRSSCGCDCKNCPYGCPNKNIDGNPKVPEGDDSE